MKQLDWQKELWSEKWMDAAGCCSRESSSFCMRVTVQSFTVIHETVIHGWFIITLLLASLRSKALTSGTKMEYLGPGSQYIVKDKDF